MIEKLTQMADRAKAAAKALDKLEQRAAPELRRAAKDAETRLAARMQVARDIHELHCLAVEIGIASPEPHRYGERRASIGFGREVLENFRPPEDSKSSDNDLWNLLVRIVEQRGFCRAIGESNFDFLQRALQRAQPYRVPPSEQGQQ